MDEELAEEREKEELLYLEFLEVCGLANVFKAKKRQTAPTDAQVKELAKLASRLVLRSNDPKHSAANGDDDGEHHPQNFDINSQPRKILFEGKVLKKSLNSLVQHTSKRHLYLLNDVLLITSLHTTKTGVLGFSTDKFLLRNVVPLDSVAISGTPTSQFGSNEENVCSFEIITKDRPYEFITDSESEKRIWLEEIQAAIFDIKATHISRLELGWMHNIVRGTLFSAAFLGDLEMVKYHVNKLQGKSIHLHDDYGMSPLHWASLKGHHGIVEFLLDNNAKIDDLNDGLNSPLMLAAAKGHDSIVMLLLAKDADAFIRNLKDRDALFMAVLYGPNSRGLHSIVNALSNCGVNVNQYDASGATPLHECAQRNLSFPVLQLVEAGANVNISHNRNGFTPIQLACSSSSPDVETVRSLLDNGAFPNYKDASGKSPFEMVLSAHNSRHGEKAASVKSSSGLKSTLDEVSSFVQEALPVLMEIVKKGGKYNEETLSTLRPSFREAIESAVALWKGQGQPQYFMDFVVARDPNELNASLWVHDDSSKFCMLCMDKFSMRSRRHHCRACGILCCDQCSSKRLELTPIGNQSPSNPQRKMNRSGSMDSPVTSTSTSRKEKGDRVCDSCFNRLTFQAFNRHQDVMKAKKEQEKLEALEKKRELEALIQQQSQPSNQSGSNSMNALMGLLNPGDSSSGQSNSSKSATTPTSRLFGTVSATNSTQQVLNDTAVALQERGDKLAQTADRSEELREAATEYNKMARSLLKQQQARYGNRG